MAEARDKLSRPEDVAAIFDRRRRSIRILADEPERSTGTPLRLGSTPRLGNGRRRNSHHRSPAALGRENTSPLVGSGRRVVRGRGSNSVLPSWYPRTPLRDITAIVRAIERRRALLRESEGREIDSPLPQDQIIHDPSIFPSNVNPERGLFKSPKPVPRTKHTLESVGKVPKILLNITNQENGKSDALTPQKKLLNSIDQVEKVVTEELNKLKRTPAAKKAEREKKVRTLMSMR